MFTLYGDGIHDDYPAIQELLDRCGTVTLPSPEVCYTISRTLKLHSDTELRLGRFTRVRLADGSNCCMLENAEPEDWNRRIAVSGGVWDMNHRKQWANPYHFPMPNGLTARQEQARDGYTRERLYYPGYCGHAFRFNSIRELTFSDVTIENPVVYGAQFAYIEDFLVENITFDYTEGSPKLWNLDGVHFEGGCKNGIVRNLHGACHDDTVAITSDDGIYGDIENIVVDGIFGENSHSAVRLLSVRHPIKNIRISNVFGSYYTYAVIMSKYYDVPGAVGRMDNIRLENINARLCKGTVDVPGNHRPLIAIGSDVEITNLVINGLYRDETYNPLPTIGIEEGGRVRDLTVTHAEQHNGTGCPMPFLRDAQCVDNLTLTHVRTGSDVLVERPAGKETL